MNKFRITTAIATTALFTFGLAAGSVSASVVEVDGQCFDIDGNGYPRPVDCPPDIELPGPTDPFADRCYEETFGGLQIPVPCPEDDEDSMLVPILPGSYTPLPGTLTFPWLGGSGDGDDSTEADEAVEEEATPAEDSLAESAEVEADAAVDADGAEDIEISAEISEPAPSVVEESNETASAGIAEAAAVATNNSAGQPINDILTDETDRSAEVVDASFEIAASAPADAPEALSEDSAVDAVSPEVTVQDAAEQSSSLGLIAAIMLVLLGGGGLASVGVLATRKRS